MNLLFYFTNQINPLKGGTERVADNVAHGLKARGHSVYYMSRTKVDGEYDIPCYFLPDTVGITKSNIDFVNKFCQDHHIDVIINEAGNTDDIYLFSNEHIRRVKIITELHFCPSVSFRYYYRSLHLPLQVKNLKESVFNLLKWFKAPLNKRMHVKNAVKRYRYMYENSDNVVLLSPSYIPEFKKMAKLETTEKLLAIWNPNTFDVGTSNHTKEKLVIAMGRLDWSQKKIDYLLKVWKMVQPSHPEWTLSICGEGPAKEQLQTIIQKDRIKGVKFEGNVQPLSFYQRASILCMTSLFEGTPMVIVEAMQCNCVPVVYDTYSAAKDMIDDGKTGFIIPPFNKKEYAHKLSLLMDNENLCQQIGEAAKASTERFEIEGIIDQWEELIRG